MDSKFYPICNPDLEKSKIQSPPTDAWLSRSRSPPKQRNNICMYEDWDWSQRIYPSLAVRRRPQQQVIRKIRSNGLWRLALSLINRAVWQLIRGKRYAQASPFSDLVQEILLHRSWLIPSSAATPWYNLELQIACMVLVYGSWPSFDWFCAPHHLALSYPDVM
jgi:hypothetical protein